VANFILSDDRCRAMRDCTLKREAGANPARSRHCEIRGFPHDATVPQDGMGRRGNRQTRKPGDLPIRCSDEILRGKDSADRDICVVCAFSLPYLRRFPEFAEPSCPSRMSGFSFFSERRFALSSRCSGHIARKEVRAGPDVRTCFSSFLSNDVFAPFRGTDKIRAYVGREGRCAETYSHSTES